MKPEEVKDIIKKGGLLETRLNQLLNVRIEDAEKIKDAKTKDLLILS